MKLVENNDADRFQKRIVVQHAQQDAGRHDENPRARTELALEAHLKADGITEIVAAFLCHASGGGLGGEATRFQ